MINSISVSTTICHVICKYLYGRSHVNIIMTFHNASITAIIRTYQYSE